MFTHDIVSVDQLTTARLTSLPNQGLGISKSEITIYKTQVKAHLLASVSIGV